MLCPRCNKDFTTKFCPDCGYTPAASTPDITKPRKKNGCLIPILVVVGIFVIIIIIGSFASNGSDTSSSAPASAPASSPASDKPSSDKPASTPPPSSKSEPKTAPFEVELSSGNYTAGVDFPDGKYDVIAVSGSGNVISDNSFNGGINAMIGDEASNSTLGSSMYEQEYKNVKLPKGTVLSVSSVVIKIISKEASTEPLTPRNQSITEVVELGSGNYVAGEDFPEGIYDVTAVSGSGNVSSNNMFSGGINAMMGDAASNQTPLGSLYDEIYKNIDLSKDTELKVSGMKIALTPSK